MTQTQTETVQVEMRVAARRETLFPFLDNAQGMARWFGSKVDLDPRPGGTVRVDVNGRDIARGEIVEIVANERVVFTFGWEGEGHPVPPGTTTVEIALIEDGDATIVRLTHRDLPAELAGDHKDGWQHYLPRLVALGEGRDPGADEWAQ